MRELERRSGCTIGTIQTELKKLLRLDLVSSRRDGNRRYFQARTDHPLYADLCGLVMKSVGIVGLLQSLLAGCTDIDCAFIFGSLARDRAKASSDVDLMVVGTVTLRALSGRLAAVALQCGREVNPFLLTATEFRARLGENDHFLVNVMQNEKLFVRGGEDDLAKLGG